MVRELALALVDEEHVAWTEQRKVDAIVQAIGIVASFVPQEFSNSVRVTLKAGSQQDLPLGVSNISGNVVQVCVDKDGNEVKETPKQKGDNSESVAFKYWREKSCKGGVVGSKAATGLSIDYPANSPCARWQLKSYDSDGATPTKFTVTPPVPVGVSPVIEIVATSCAPCLTWGKDQDYVLPCKFTAAIREFALSDLLAIPSADTATSVQDATLHYTKAKDILNGFIIGDKRMGSGFVSGEVGDGDINFMAH
jgi:hypothetical protein